MKIRLFGVQLLHADIRTDGRTHKHDESSCRFLQFRERVWKLKIQADCENVWLSRFCKQIPLQLKIYRHFKTDKNQILLTVKNLVAKWWVSVLINVCV